MDSSRESPLAAALRQRGIDVLTTPEAGHLGLLDDDQLRFATRGKRVFFTHNRGDFARLHQEMIREGRSHAGIILCDQLPVGVLLRRLSNLCFWVTQEEMANRLEFLGSWG